MIKGILTLGNATWNEKGRYKVNSAVNYNGSVYQNSTGGNSVPTLLVDWVLIKENALSTQISKFKEIYESGLQEFTLPDFAQIISVFVRGHRTENYTVLGNVITINNAIGSGSEVVILYLEDLATGIVPYYTQAQVDALILGTGGAGGAESGEWTPVISALSNITSVTNGNAYWSKIGNMVTLNYSANMVLAASGLLAFEITVPTAYPIVFENNNVGNGVMQNNGFTAVLAQSLAGGTKVSISSKATIASVYNALLNVSITYKTT